MDSNQPDGSSRDLLGPHDLSDTMLLSMVHGVGPRIRLALLERFGTSTAVLSANPGELRSVAGVGPKLCNALARARHDIDVTGQIEACRRHGVTILPETSQDYPRLLREIHDPPAILYVRGRIDPADALGISIVGSRHATQYGLAQAERLAGSLARAGLAILSGLARGIDAAAHRGALAAGGRTLAVLGSGVLNVYPPEHGELAEQVAQSGAVMSEVPVHAAPLGASFPQRNRLISGLSLGVIVVEASARSGALITARHAMEQGREVFAVPGRVDSRMSHGCHRLIRDGAKLVETAEDVLEELGPLVEAAPRPDGRTIHHPAELMLNALEQQVLEAVGIEPTPIDSIIAASGLAAPQVLATLSVLEMRHLVRRVSGTLILRR